MDAEQFEPEWDGDNPFYLLILRTDVGQVCKLDLDEKGWLARLGEEGWLRAPGQWHLVRKSNDTVAFSLWVHDGEQPYYVARHIGVVGAGGGEGREVVCYGIGKKRVDGQVDRVWALPNGQIVIGDDVEPFARSILNGG